MKPRTNETISAVVCTKNSIKSVADCLRSLRDAGVDEIIVVDAHSFDGTREVAQELADVVLTDPGVGLGFARNLGIARSVGHWVLNMGSDNVMPPGQLDRMINALADGSLAGVSAQTRILGKGYLAFGLNAWRSSRFPSGPATVIGTPTLFPGDLLRTDPFDENCAFSDDSELCERWSWSRGSKFAIADAYVIEVGKVSFEDVWTRARMYGHSDAEIYRRGTKRGWSLTRRLRSIIHPIRVDLFSPLVSLPPSKAIAALPFLSTFSTMRYLGWLTALGRW